MLCLALGLGLFFHEEQSLIPVFIAIPFFKNASYLKETLQSLINQTDTDWRAVVLDDSVDEFENKAALQCVTGFQDSRVTFFRNSKNLGLAKNWNQALAMATESHETLCLILHADDRLLPDYIEEMKRLANRFPEATGYFAKVDIIGPNGKRVFSLADFYKRILVPKAQELVIQGIPGMAQLISGNFIFCPSICYRVQKLKNESFSEQLKMVLDFEFILRILKKGGMWVGTYEHSLFEYRRHPESVTNSLTQNKMRFYEEIWLYRNLGIFLLEQGQPKIARKALAMRVVKLNLAYQIFRALVCFKWRVAFQFTRVYWK